MGTGVAVGRGRAGSSYETGSSAGGPGGAASSGGGGAGVGGQNFQSSKFVRVPGKHGWFGLRDPHSLPSVGIPSSVIEAEDRLLMDTVSGSDVMNDDQIQNGSVEQELTFEPKAFYSTNMLNQQYSRKRRHSYHSSGGESVSSLSGGGSEDELAGEMGDGDGSSEFTSDEDSGADEALYRKKYLFVKRVAKNMIHVCKDVHVYSYRIA